MIASMSALVVCIMMLMVTSWLSLNRQEAAVHDLLVDGIEHLSRLKIVSDRYAVDIVDTTHKVVSGALKPAEGVQKITASLAEIDTEWKAFSAFVHTAKEMEITKKAEAAIRVARLASEKVRDLMAAGKSAELSAFRDKDLYPAIDPATDLISQIMDTELKNARQTGSDAVAIGMIANKILLAVSVLSCGLCLGVLLYILRGVVFPLRDAISTMTRLGEATRNDADVVTFEAITITGSERSDELGIMARTLETFREGSIERTKLRYAAEAEQIARGQRAQRVETLISDFESASAAIVSTVASASHELEASAQSMTAVAHSASEQAGLVAAASEQTSCAVVSLSNMGGELASSIHEISRQAEQSSTFAGRAAERASAADATVSKLNAASHAIVEVVDLIKNIAGQTNLLALNATIEAARAGEMGKGFAVVASEVKELASQTTHATDVISEHVRAIQDASIESIDAMQAITRMISEIHQVASAIAVAVTEQGAAVEGIAENVNQVSQGAAHTSQAINVVSSAANSTGVAASQVLSASSELAHQSTLMREKVDEFLHAVRTA